MHVHLGILEAVRVFLYVIVIGFFWRTIAANLHETDIGQAMAFLY